MEIWSRYTIELRRNETLVLHRVVCSTNQAVNFGIQGYLAHKKQPPLGPYGMHMPRALWCFYGGVLFLMSEVPM